MDRHASGGKEQFPCPCCGYCVHPEPPGSYGICPICFWEDDLTQLLDPQYSGGANHPSLVEAQMNFKLYGCCEARLSARVRRPTEADAQDPTWRAIDPQSDDIRRFLGEVRRDKEIDLGQAYYWRRLSNREHR